MATHEILSVCPGHLARSTRVPRFDATCDESLRNGANLVGHLRGGPVDHVVGAPRRDDDRITVDASCRKLERNRFADAR